MKRYRMCKCNTPYGEMYLVEKRFLFFWIEFCYVCSIEDAMYRITRDSSRRSVKYEFYDQNGKKINA